jgi:hypothetical protein
MELAPTLPNALWDYRITPKYSIGNSPLFLVYGKEDVFPKHTFVPYLQLSQSVQDKKCLVIQQRLNMLLWLEEDREKSKKKLM